MEFSHISYLGSLTSNISPSPHLHHEWPKRDLRARWRWPSRNHRWPARPPPPPGCWWWCCCFCKTSDTTNNGNLSNTAVWRSNAHFECDPCSSHLVVLWSRNGDCNQNNQGLANDTFLVSMTCCKQWGGMGKAKWVSQLIENQTSTGQVYTTKRISRFMDPAAPIQVARLSITSPNILSWATGLAGG